MIQNKKGIEMSFGWIFALIVGMAILFLSIYGVSKLIDTERQVVDTTSAQKLGSVLFPVSTGLEDSYKPEPIVFPGDTRIEVACNLQGPLGENSLKVSRRSGIGEPWQNSGIPAVSKDSYVFSEKNLESKEFYSLIKPIAMPFKIGDAVVVWDKQYCFVAPPGTVEDEITALGLDSSKIEVVDSENICPRESKVVCFSGRKNSCDVTVDITNKRVSKDSGDVYYEDSLLFGAIISDPEIYECQIERIGKRAERLSSIYHGKSVSISTKSNGCSSIMQNNLKFYGEVSKDLSSNELGRLIETGNELERLNRNAICQLWEDI